MRNVLFAVSFWLFATSSAYPWGQEGHSVVAEIAQRRLNADASKLTAELLGPGHSLAAASDWADDVRDDRPETYNWHFVDIPLAADDYVPARDCKTDPQKGDCAVAEIDRARKALACETSTATRVEALKYLIHFVGDIHQPLHTIGEAKGGNEVRVQLAMRGLTCGAHCTPHPSSTNLHAAWDSGLILKTVWNWGAYVDRLESGYLRTADATVLAGGTAADWSVETHRLGRRAWDAVPANGVLGDDYFDLALPIIDQQLGTAGIRLANVLNTIATTGCPQ